MIVIRDPENIYQARGTAENGRFFSNWHFSFDRYNDPANTRFGTLITFNDETLSPGAAGPLHPHQNIEIVIYCADGEFLFADEYGKGNILKKGCVQHTTAGKGVWHLESNNRRDIPVRFIQMWFLPSERGLEPYSEQMPVRRNEYPNRLIPIASNRDNNTLPLFSDASVYTCLLERGKNVNYPIAKNRGVYMYNLEGGPVVVNNFAVHPLAAAAITETNNISISTNDNAELLLIDALLA